MVCGKYIIILSICSRLVIGWLILILKNSILNWLVSIFHINKWLDNNDTQSCSQFTVQLLEPGYLEEDYLIIILFCNGPMTFMNFRAVFLRGKLSSNCFKGFNVCIVETKFRILCFQKPFFLDSFLPGVQFKWIQYSTWSF